MSSIGPELQHRLNKAVRLISKTDPLDPANGQLAKLIEGVTEKHHQNQNEIALLEATKRSYTKTLEEQRISLEQSQVFHKSHLGHINDREEKNRILQDLLTKAQKRTQAIVAEIDEVNKIIQNVKLAQARQAELYKSLFGVELYNKDAKEIEVILTNVSPHEEDAGITVTCSKDPHSTGIFPERCAPALHSFDHLRERVNSSDKATRLDWVRFVAALREIYQLQYNS